METRENKTVLLGDITKRIVNKLQNSLNLQNKVGTLSGKRKNG